MQRNTFRYLLNLGDTRLDRFKSGCHLQQKACSFNNYRLFLLRFQRKYPPVLPCAEVTIHFLYIIFIVHLRVLEWDHGEMIGRSLFIFALLRATMDSK